MDLRDYVAMVRAHRLMIALTTLTVLGLTAAFTYTQVPEYQATTRLFVSTSAADEATLNQGGQFSIQRVQSYADLLNGAEISRRVVKRLGLNENPRELTKQISATAKLNTVILVINVRDPSPARAQALANAVAKEFVEFIAELETPPGQTQPTVKATIVDAASEPDSPVSPQPLRNLPLGLVMGLMAGAGLAVLRESFDSSVRSIKDLEELTNSPILGSVPFDKAATDQPLIRDLDAYSPRVEAFRVLRTNLQFINPDQNHKVFVITSPLPEEGKTTTAANLALSLAEGGEKVALVEADLRRARVSAYLRLAGTVGLTTILIGRIGLDEAIQPAGRLDVITGGRVPPNPAELIKSEAMHHLIESLRERYDYVLIDAPPLLPVTDAALLAAQADGAILVARHGQTTHDQVTTAVARVQAVNAQIVGVVMSMTPKSRARGGFGFGYGYGYGYGYAPDAKQRAKRRTRRRDGELSQTTGIAEASPMRRG